VTGVPIYGHVIDFYQVTDYRSLDGRPPRQPQGASSIIQAITAQGPYVAARGGVEPTTFPTEGLST